MFHSTSCPKLATAIACVVTLATSLTAQITVLNTASVVSPEADDSKTAVLSFDAGAAADKLIVQVSAEGENIDSITYQSIPLAEARALNLRDKTDKTRRRPAADRQ